MVSLVAGARGTFQVSYRLKLAKLRRGRVGAAFFAGCTRRFATAELNVILADIYAEVGPAPDLLGIEILTITRVPAPALTITLLSNIL